MPLDPVDSAGGHSWRADTGSVLASAEGGTCAIGREKGISVAEAEHDAADLELQFLASLRWSRLG